MFTYNIIFEVFPDKSCPSPSERACPECSGGWGGWGEAYFLKTNLIILFFFFTTIANAQYSNEVVQLTHYVFNKFMPGTVTMKSGESSNQLLNYNILTNEMIFDTDGKLLAIANPENVDTIYINYRKFIPISNRFYEVLVNAEMPLLLEFTATVTEPGTATGYGGSSTTTASTSYKSLIGSGGAYSLKLPDNFKVVPGFVYWIMKDDQLQKIGKANQLIKIFPGKKNIINDAIKRNNLKVSNREDIIMLIRLIE